MTPFRSLGVKWSQVQTLSARQYETRSDQCRSGFLRFDDVLRSRASVSTVPMRRQSLSRQRLQHAQLGMHYAFSEFLGLRNPVLLPQFGELGLQRSSRSTYWAARERAPSGTQATRAPATKDRAAQGDLRPDTSGARRRR
jgi:hypothetical protein